MAAVGCTVVFFKVAKNIHFCSLSSVSPMVVFILKVDTNWNETEQKVVAKFHVKQNIAA